MRKINYLLGLAALVSLCSAAQSREAHPARAAKIAQGAAFGERALININNISMWFRRDGYSGGNPYNDNSGITYPRSTDQIIFRDGLIWGGRVLDGDPQELRVGGQTYEIGTVPGRIVSKGVAESADDPSVRIFRIRRDYRTADLRLDAAEMLNIGLSEVADADVAALRAQYDKDWREWPAAKGAPYYDRDGNGRYEPKFNANGTPDLTKDEPGVASADQVAWFVLNDLDPGASAALYGSNPIGLEVQVTLWGYARTDALGDVVFKKYRVIYKGKADTPDTASIKDMYFAQWSDPDLGDFGDDFAGSDVDLSLGYVYNSITEDSHYQAFDLAPPAAGYDFLQGPIVPVYTTDAEGNQVLDENAEAIFNFGKRKGYKNLPMTSFVYFAAGSSISDPELGAYNGTRQWYNLLRGFQPQEDVDNPVPYTDPQGNPTLFTLNGDPTRATGWNDGVPLPAGDRRIVLDTGPFEMALGDTQEVVVALVAGIGSDRLRSVAKMKFNDQFVQDAYNSFFQVASPPSPPDVRLAQLDQTIVLDWGWNKDAVTKTETQGSPGFGFEGYNLYQLPSAEAILSQGRKLATYDLDNGVTTILGIDLDEVSGVVLDVPKQIGGDFGLRRSVKLTQDALRGTPLVNGQRYYFAVTAYNRNTSEGAAVTSLESAAQVLVCVPQSPPPGTRYLSDAGQTLDAVHSTGKSDGTAQVLVVDPTHTTGDNYQVVYRDSVHTEVDADGNEVVTSLVVWDLRNTSDNKILLAGQTDQSGAGQYVGAEGIEMQVSGPPKGMKDWTISGGERWWTWAAANWGAEGFQGAITGDPNGAGYFSPSTVTPAQLRTVEIRFTTVVTDEGENQYKPVDLNNPNVSYAYRYMRGAANPAPATADLTTTAAPYDWSKYIVNASGGYSYQDRVPICLSAWDIEANPPRRLEVGFLENNGPGGLVNGAYGPAFNGKADNVAGGGPREWLYVFDLPYTADRNGGSDLLKTANAAGDPLPLMWIVFAARRQEARFPLDGDAIQLIANHVNTKDDVFAFTVPGVLTSPDSLAADVKRVNVFPNPYYGINEAETSRYAHFVTFSHLPRRVKIRIFDLAGTLVRTLDETDKSNPADQFLQWDLSNEEELPVASGLYIAHVEMPEANKTKILKLAVIQEQQFLENY
ncbi:MAG: T9SS type A sorting domain-containing protein [Candidatus Latescibacteria bacterium]|nr:T9SS type A sorting domain-containing protein [Candidatus Latescibacterota bacterium]